MQIGLEGLGVSLELHRLGRDRSAGCGLVFEITEQLRGDYFISPKLGFPVKYMNVLCNSNVRYVYFCILTRGPLSAAKTRLGCGWLRGDRRCM